MNTTLYGVAVIPAIIGLVQVACDAGLPGRLGPLLAVILGIAASIADVVAHPPVTGPTVVAAVLAGVVLGLTAEGLYHGLNVVKTGSTNDGRTGEAPQSKEVLAASPTPPLETP